MAKKKGIVNQIADSLQGVVGNITGAMNKKDGGGDNMPTPQQMNAKPQSQYNSKYGIFAGLDD